MFCFFFLMFPYSFGTGEKIFHSCPCHNLPLLSHSMQCLSHPFSLFLYAYVRRQKKIISWEATIFYSYCFAGGDFYRAGSDSASFFIQILAGHSVPLCLSLFPVVYVTQRSPNWNGVKSHHKHHSSCLRVKCINQDKTPHLCCKNKVAVTDKHDL